MKSERSEKPEKSEKSEKSERSGLGHSCDAERTEGESPVFILPVGLLDISRNNWPMHFLGRSLSVSAPI